MSFCPVRKLRTARSTRGLSEAFGQGRTGRTENIRFRRSKIYRGCPRRSDSNPIGPYLSDCPSLYRRDRRRTAGTGQQSKNIQQDPQPSGARSATWCAVRRPDGHAPSARATWPGADGCDLAGLLGRTPARPAASPVASSGCTWSRATQWGLVSRLALVRLPGYGSCCCSPGTNRMPGVIATKTSCEDCSMIDDTEIASLIDVESDEGRHGELDAVVD